MLAMAAGLFLGMGQFYERYLKEDAIDIFTDTVYLTADNQPSGFLSFLQRNNQKVIYLSTWLDASLHRITSYNVCYTKLLRASKKSRSVSRATQ